jgi:hypothetical protein
LMRDVKKNLLSWFCNTLTRGRFIFPQFL